MDQEARFISELIRIDLTHRQTTENVTIENFQALQALP